MSFELAEGSQEGGRGEKAKERRERQREKKKRENPHNEKADAEHSRAADEQIKFLCPKVHQSGGE